MPSQYPLQVGQRPLEPALYFIVYVSGQYFTINDSRKLAVQATSQVRHLIIKCIEICCIILPNFNDLLYRYIFYILWNDQTQRKKADRFSMPLLRERSRPQVISEKCPDEQIICP